MKEFLQFVALIIVFFCAGLIIFEFICGLIMGYNGPLGELNQYLKAELRWRHKPLLYVCKSNGVIGVVRARDYHRALRRVWRVSERNGLQEARPLISPTFRFFNPTPDNHANTGLLENYNKLASQCRIVYADFVVSAAWSEAKWTPGLPIAYEMIFGKRRGRKLYQQQIGCLSNC